MHKDQIKDQISCVRCGFPILIEKTTGNIELCPECGTINKLEKDQKGGSSKD